ncbi:hypothetical protein EYW49_09670 [Siculibacillus lacustris]|uniref:Uncharacterized protein n=1 Tax=Siculibacillus lacustris TaxID=1549641 RepID=A0A4Q9VQT6_9HYPH|nr:hypothetical protein [Siculibacillus lacustris]TBW38209.1 hypothetical protein EYW49_09670 [Siculibacillus lacustris]
MSSTLARTISLAALLALAVPAGAHAFDRDQWRGSTSDDGGWRLDCDAPACVPGSLVTFTVKPPHAVADLATYEATLAHPAPEFARRGITVATGPVRRSVIGRFVLYRATRTLTLPDGRRQIGPMGVLVGDDLSLSLFSLSPDPAAAERNFTGVATWLARHPPKPGGQR